MPSPNKDTKRFGVDLSGTPYQYLLALSEAEILNKSDAWIHSNAKNDSREKVKFGDGDGAKQIAQKLLLILKADAKVALTDEEKKLSNENKVKDSYVARKNALKAVSEEQRTKALENDKKVEAQAPAPAQAKRVEKGEITEVTNRILDKLSVRGITSYNSHLREIETNVTNVDTDVVDPDTKEAYGQKYLNQIKKSLDVFENALDAKGYSAKDRLDRLDRTAKLLSEANVIYQNKSLGSIAGGDWTVINQDKLRKELDEKNKAEVIAFEKKEKYKIKEDSNILENLDIGGLDDEIGGRNAIHGEAESEKIQQKKKTGFFERLFSSKSKKEPTAEEEVDALEQINIFDDEAVREENKGEKNKGEEAKKEQPKAEEVKGNNEPKNENQNNLPAQEQKADAKKVDAQKIEVNNENNAELNNQNPAKQNDEKKNLDNKEKADMLSANAEKNLMAYEKSVNQRCNNVQAIRDSIVRRSASQISESENEALLADNELFDQNEQALRSSFKSVAEEKEINIPELIKNQVRLEAGELSPTERMQHYQQIIRMKDADGDQYSRKLAEYRTKVAESAGKEYDQEHKDHTKLSFLNKTANAIEKIMCAMTKNPLGLVILLVAAVNAPLMMVGLLGFMAWKRKHPDMGYQKALQAQQQREIQDMRQKLATKHGVNVEKIPESEAKKALREEYVRNKANEAVYEKLEKESKKQVDKAAHAYAKDIKKQGLGKFSGKEIKEHFRREVAADPVFRLENKRDNNLKTAMKSVKPSQKGKTL